MSGSRQGAIARATKHFDSGGFFADLARRVAYRTVSQDPTYADHLGRYLRDELTPAGLRTLDPACRVLDVVQGEPRRRAIELALST